MVNGALNVVTFFAPPLEGRLRRPHVAATRQIAQKAVGQAVGGHELAQRHRHDVHDGIFAAPVSLSRFCPGFGQLVGDGGVGAPVGRAALANHGVGTATTSYGYGLRINNAQRTLWSFDVWHECLLEDALWHDREQQ